MESHGGGGQIQFSLELLHEPNQLCDLAIRERPAVAVADQGDADGVLVVIVAVGPDAMGTRVLVDPSVSDMDHAIAQPIAVSDKEMVAHAPVSEAEVALPHRLRVPRRRTGVVDDDSSPPVPIQRGGGPEDWIERLSVREYARCDHQISTPPDLIVSGPEQEQAGYQRDRR